MEEMAQARVEEGSINIAGKLFTLNGHLLRLAERHTSQQDKQLSIAITSLDSPGKKHQA